MGVHDGPEYAGELFVAEEPGEHRFFSGEVFWLCVPGVAGA